jgi:hypothetical protein
MTAEVWQEYRLLELAFEIRMLKLSEWSKMPRMRISAVKLWSTY